jgi:hypothetical protein
MQQVCPKCRKFGRPIIMDVTNLYNPCCRRCGYIQLPEQCFFPKKEKPRMAELIFRLEIYEG